MDQSTIEPSIDLFSAILLVGVAQGLFLILAILAAPKKIIEPMWRVQYWIMKTSLCIATLPGFTLLLLLIVWISSCFLPDIEELRECVEYYYSSGTLAQSVLLPASQGSNSTLSWCSRGAWTDRIGQN